MPLTGDSLDSIDPEINYLQSFEENMQSDYISTDQFNYELISARDMCTILNYNIRSFHRNSDAFLPIIDKSMPHIIVLTETWFSPDYRANIPNYRAHHTTRIDRHSGGASVFIKDDWSSTKLDSLSFITDQIEVCCAEVDVRGENVVVLSIYRPHSGTIDGFTIELEGILSSRLLRNRRIFAAGDFNCNLMLDSSQIGRFVDFFKSYNFYPVITKPTRFSPNDNSPPSLIDHIWVNSLNICKSGIISYDTTDHCPCFVQFPLLQDTLSADDSQFTRINFRLNDQEHRDRFRRSLVDFNWSSIKSDNINHYVDNFTSAIDGLYCAAFPMKSKLISRKKMLNPWFTRELGDLINMKSTYFNLLREGLPCKVCPALREGLPCIESGKKQI